MKRTLRTAMFTLALVSLFSVCFTMFTYAGSFGASPDRTEILSVTNTAEGVYLNWGKSDDAEFYKIYRRLPEQLHPEEIAEIDSTQKNEYTDTTAQSGKKYEYTLRAFKGIFFSSLSGATEIVRLSQPSIKSVASGDGCIELMWGKSPGADGYYIYKKTDSGIKLLNTVYGENNCSCSDTDISEKGIYTYTVTAFNGKYRSSHTYKTSEMYVAPPVIKSVINTQKGSIALSWQKPKYADSYNVYRKTGNSNEWVKIKTLPAKAGGFEDFDVMNGTFYTYTVRTLSNNIYSGFNKKGVNIQCLGVPASFKAVNSDDCVELSWEQVESAQSYRIYKEYNGTSAIISTTPHLSFSDSDVADGTKYTYYVKAVGSNENMLSASTQKTTVTVVKKPPEIIGASVFDGVKISWKKSDIATGYKVYRKKQGEEKWREIKSLGAAASGYTDRDVKSGEVYVYTVRCMKDGVYGSYDTQGVIVRYIPQLGIKATVCPQGIKLQWSEINGCTGFEIFRGNGNGEDWSKIATFEPSQTGCIDGSPVYGEKNSYFVRVLFSQGDFTDSNTSSAYGIDPTKPMVALTYDDGPNPDVTNRILSKLAENNGRATFFVVGERVSGYADCLKRAVSLGCEIGNHTYHHKDISDVSAQEVASEIMQTNNAVQKITGVSPVLARAPGGALSDTARQNADMPFIFWSIDTLDWKYRKSSSVISRVKNEVKDGSIVLMHDLYVSTADASDELIPWLKENGYQLVTVSEMLAVKGIETENGKTYVSGSK